MIIVPNSLNISQLFGSTSAQYVIPTYQRRYSWHRRQVWELIDDIRLIEDGDTHLLGSVVCLVSTYNAGMNKLELVDGQQRLTTLAILLECIRQRLEAFGGTDEAAEVGRLLTSKALGGKPLRKVVLDSIDSVEFESLIANEDVEHYQNADLQTAFKIIREWISEQTLNELITFLYRLTNQAIVIRLDVSDAKDAFKLFETINNRGLRLSPTDIIKNFLLGNAARFGESELEAARTGWAALIRHLDGTNSDAFFRYYLMALVRVRLTAAEVVPEFKKVFMCRVREAEKLPERHLYPDPVESEDEDANTSAEDVPSETSNAFVDTSKPVPFKTFLAQLVQSSKVFGELVLARTDDAVINRHLRNLRMIKAVQTYGFLTHLLATGCSDKNFKDILKLTESFVLRRHVCRERSNETEALFARLSGVDSANPIESIREAYRELCPLDDVFRDEFAAANFTANVLERARYCLEQIELAKHGKHEELQVLGPADVHVEHIIPQKITTKKAKEEFGDWITYLGEKSEKLHTRYVSRIGNLTLFAGALNIEASNNPFEMKKCAYNESGIKITRELLDQSHFQFAQVEDRSNQLAEIAVKLWPRP